MQARTIQGRKMTLQKWISASLIALIVCLPISVANAKIRVGTVKFDPPYVLSLDQGFEIELIKHICQDMNEECELIPMQYSQLFEALLQGTIDIGIDSIPFFANSTAPYIYSSPYLLSTGQFLILKTSKINFIMDMPKGASIGLVQENWTPDNGPFYKFCTAKFGDRFKIVPFVDIDSMIDALAKGQIAAAFLDSYEARYWEGNGDDKFVALEKPMPVADGIGIAALPQNKPIIDKINAQLKKIESDQTYINLYKTYLSVG